MRTHPLAIFSLTLLSSIGFYTFLNAADQAPSQQPQSAQPQQQFSAQTFNAVLERIREDYVEEPDEDKLLGGALNGMLSSMDPHSAYFDKKEFKELQEHTKGEFGGLGIEVVMDQKSGGVKIVSPIDDTPADKAGLQPEDVIIAVDKKSVMEMSIFEAVELMRGEPGTKVLLHIKRKKKDIFPVTIERAIIKADPVKSRREGDVGYIRLSVFNEKTTEKLKAAVDSLIKDIGPKKIQGLVIDVRNNPGGLFEEAILSSDLFLSEGNIVSTKGRDERTSARADATPGDIADGIPIVILINGGSASAAEILAGALQDNHRGIVVGNKSFGKGSVQIIMPLSNEGALKLTIARYYTPSGRSIQAEGIEPDIIVDQAVNLDAIKDDGRIREKDIKDALGNAEDSKKTTEQEEDLSFLEEGEDKDTEEIKDYQLQEALHIVKAIWLAQQKSLR